MEATQQNSVSLDKEDWVMEIISQNKRRQDKLDYKLAQQPRPENG